MSAGLSNQKASWGKLVLNICQNTYFLTGLFTKSGKVTICVRSGGEKQILDVTKTNVTAKLVTGKADIYVVSNIIFCYTQTHLINF